MRNGYFQLVNCAGGFGVALFPPVDGGEKLPVMEVANYLDGLKIPYNLSELNRSVEAGTETVFFLGEGNCPVENERIFVRIAPDRMSATVRFFCPSETGKRMTFQDAILDLRQKGVNYGVDTAVLQAHFCSNDYFCKDLIVARGRLPRHGKDAEIQYFFNTDLHIQPTLREDGTVDYYHLNLINQCKKGDELARVIPEDLGEPGKDVMGNPLKPKDVKRATLKFGRNIQLSEDKRSLIALVDGHVSLVDDKVFLSDVYTVENVDLSTGNIDFQGSVQVNGNVAGNMQIHAGGNVTINGVVEGAFIEAGGNIVIARGMSGMSKGNLKAGGDIVAKFIESSTAYAGGNIFAEAILYSNVSAGDEIVVDGKKGLVTGGHIQAGNRVTAKNMGSEMGSVTVVEVGVKPQLKEEYIGLQMNITELVKVIKNVQPIIANFQEKRAKGARITPDQVEYVRKNAVLLQEKKTELERANVRLQELQKTFECSNRAEVIVRDVVSPGTTITIGDLSMVVKSSIRFCKFEKRDGSVVVNSL